MYIVVFSFILSEFRILYFTTFQNIKNIAACFVNIWIGLVILTLTLLV